MLPPVEIRLDRARRCLTIDFGADARYRLPAEYLRVETSSAERLGHHPDQRQIVHGRAGVTILAIEPVGNYAIRLIFDDRHDSGIYTWPYLEQLGREHDGRWAAYLAELAAHGLAR